MFKPMKVTITPTRSFTGTLWWIFRAVDKRLEYGARERAYDPSEDTLASAKVHFEGKLREAAGRRVRVEYEVLLEQPSSFSKRVEKMNTDTSEVSKEQRDKFIDYVNRRLEVLDRYVDESAGALGPSIYIRAETLLRALPFLPLYVFPALSPNYRGGLMLMFSDAENDVSVEFGIDLRGFITFTRMYMADFDSGSMTTKTSTWTNWIEYDDGFRAEIRDWLIGFSAHIEEVNPAWYDTMVSGIDL